MKLTVRAPAKINLYLDILGKLPNGFHSLAMVMQSVDLCDTVTITETEEPGIRLRCSDPGIPCDERNIAWKAADAFYTALGMQPQLELTIEKRIPAAAGLAGGSADGAAVFAGLNALHGKPMSDRALAALSLTVGTDLPFCLQGGTCLAQHTGGILSPLPPLPPCTVVLSKPQRAVSTAEAYAEADHTRLYHPNWLRMLDACAAADLDAICKEAGNVFEQIVDVPERVSIKQVMRRHHTKLCQMSGSGPTVFGLFDDPEAAAACADELRAQFPQTYLASPCDHGAIVV